MAKRISAPSHQPMAAVAASSDESLSMGVEEESTGGGLGFEHKEGATASISAAGATSAGRRTNRAVAVSPAPQSMSDASPGDGSAVWSASRHGVNVPSVATPQSYARNNSSETLPSGVG